MVSVLPVLVGSQPRLVFVLRMLQPALELLLTAEAEPRTTGFGLPLLLQGLLSQFPELLAGSLYLWVGVRPGWWSRRYLMQHAVYGKIMNVL